MSKELSRRRFLELTAGGTAVTILAGLGLDRMLQRSEDEQREPVDEAEILQSLRELEYPTNAELSGTLLLRKLLYDVVQVIKLRGEWPEGQDESDWLSHPEIIQPALERLAAAGITSVRLGVFSSELTHDGQNINWGPLDRAIEMCKQAGITTEISGGPIDYPYHPGIRLPQQLLELLQSEQQENGRMQIHISLQEDPAFPEASIRIRDFCLSFWTEQLQRYGEHEDVKRFYLGNEWPDAHGIEGLPRELENFTLSMGKDLMLEMARIAREHTSKKIALNTRFGVDELPIIQEQYGEILEELGEQGVLGFDIYAEREQQSTDHRIRDRVNTYASSMERMRAAFPLTEFVSTEYQSDPWIEGTEGQSWVDIYQQYPDQVRDFYERVFPRSIETHIIAPQIAEIGVWGLPTVLVLADLGYDLPLRMLQAIKDGMERSQENAAA